MAKHGEYEGEINGLSCLTTYRSDGTREKMSKVLGFCKQEASKPTMLGFKSIYSDDRTMTDKLSLQVQAMRKMMGITELIFKI